MTSPTKWNKHALYLCATLSLLGGLSACGEKQAPPVAPGVNGQMPGQLDTGFQPIQATDPGFVDPNAGFDAGVDAGFDGGVAVDPGLDPGLNPGVDPGLDPGIDAGVDAGVIGDGSVDPGTDPTFNPTDEGVIGDDIPGGEAPIDANNPYVGDPADDGSDLLGGSGDLPDLGGDVFGSEPPAADPSKGNTFLGIVKNPKVVSISGLATSGSQIYLGHYNDGYLSNDRYIRSFNLNDGSTNDVSIYSQFSDGDNPTRLIKGVAVANGELWATLNAPDGDGFNVFRYSTSGSKIKTYSVGQSGLGDIAVGGGKAFIASPADQGVVSLDIQSSQANLISSGTPAGVGVDSSGNVYITTSGNIIKYNGSTGAEMLRFNGTGTDGGGKAISNIGDVAVDPNNGDIYVISGSGPGTVIARYDSSGNYIHSFGNSNLTAPQAIAIGSNGHIYVNDTQLGAAVAFDAGQ